MVEAIDGSSRGLVFVVGESGELIGSVTDGDVRRALLAGHGLDSPAHTAYNTDCVALQETSVEPTRSADEERSGLAAYPVVNSFGRLLSVDVAVIATNSFERENTVVIMAGGKGLRLRPLTEQTPKPMLLVAGKPILQHLIENLRDQGFTNIVMSINYLGDQIERFFDDGTGFGVSIRYLKETDPMGTAGALSLLEQPILAPVVMMNGDLIISANLGKMLDFHEKNGADITVGAKVLETTIPFGVLSTEGHVINGIEEKPSRRELVNAGVYVLDPSTLLSISKSAATDMPDLILDYLPNRKVIAFAIHEAWADLGAPEDLRRAQEILGGR